MELSVTVSSKNQSPALSQFSSAGFGCTQGALDGLGGGRTRTVTVSAGLSAPSLTVSENTRSVRTVGAVKVGACAVVLLSITVSPPVCVQA